MKRIVDKIDNEILSKLPDTHRINKIDLLNVIDTAQLVDLQYIQDEISDIDLTVLEDMIDLKLDISSKASTAEAEAGVNDTNYMTPLKTKQAIDELATATPAGVNGDIQVNNNGEFGASHIKLGSGDNSMTWGDITTSPGSNSTAFGFNTEASAFGSTAWGANTISSAFRSTAFGINTLASSSNSTAWGASTTASGYSSTSWGGNTNASAFYSTSWGNSTVSSANSSTAWGGSTTASGYYSTAWGQSSIASGLTSTVWGHNNTLQSTATYSTIAGGQNITGTASHTVYTPKLVIGRGTSGSLPTTGETHGLGYNDTTGEVVRIALPTSFTLANGSGTIASGSSVNLGGNLTTNSTINTMNNNFMVIGEGLKRLENNFTFFSSTTSQRLILSGSNLEIGTYYSDGSAGNENYYIDTTTSGIRLNWMTQGTVGGPTFSRVIFDNGVLSYDADRSLLYTNRSIVDKEYVDSVAGSSGSLPANLQAGSTGTNSLRWGDSSNTSSGNYSTAWGKGTTASGSRSTAWGYNTTSSNYYSTSWGVGSVASGSRSTAWGQNTTGSGSWSTVWGQSSISSGNYSTAFGISTEAQGEASVVWGRSNLLSALAQNSTIVGGRGITGLVESTVYMPRLRIGMGVLNDGVTPAAIPVFADNAAASSLLTGDVYRTPTGQLMVKY